MRGRKLIVSAVALAASTMAVAQSRYQQDTGSLLPVPERARIPDSGDQAERSRLVLAQFARCTVDRRATQLRKLLVLPLDKLSGASWGALADDECLAGGEIRFKPILLRGAVFVELYRRQMKGGQAAHFSFKAAPYQPTTVANTGTLDDALLAFADCIVGLDRVDASAMVVAGTASREQDGALGRLRPSLGSCLPQGQKISLSRPVLEGSIAEILFRGPAQARPAESH